MSDGFLFESDSAEHAEEVIELEEEPSNRVFSATQAQGLSEMMAESHVSPDPHKSGNGLLTEQINSLTEERERLHAEVEKYKRSSKSYMESLDKSESKVKKLSDSVTVLETKLKEKDDLITEYERIKEEGQLHINKLMGIAKANKEAYNKAKLELESVRNASNASDEVKKQLEDTINQLTLKQESLDKLQLDYDKMENDFNSLNNELNSLKDSSKALQEERDSLNSRNEELERILSDLENNNSIKDSEVVINLKDEINELRLKLTESLIANESSSADSLISLDRLRKIEDTIAQNREKYDSLYQSFKDRESEFLEKEINFKKHINELNLTIQELKLTNAELQSNYESMEVELKVSKEEVAQVNKAKHLVELSLSESNVKNEELLSKMAEIENKLKSSLTETTIIKDRLNFIVTSPMFKDFNLSADDFIDSIPQSITEVVQFSQTDKVEIINGLEKQIDGLTSTITSLKEELTSVAYDKEILENKLKDVDGQLETISSQKDLLESKLRESEDSLEELEKLKSDLQGTVDSLNDKVKSQEELLNNSTQKDVESVSSEELETAKSRIASLEQSLSDTKVKLKKRDEQVKALKNSEAEGKNLIAKLQTALTELSKSNDSGSVDSFTQEVFGLTPEDLFKKFNEFTVTLEVANYNLEAMKGFPKAREIVDKRVAENKPKLASILTREFKYNK